MRVRQNSSSLDGPASSTAAALGDVSPSSSSTRSHHDATASSKVWTSASSCAARAMAGGLFSTSRWPSGLVSSKPPSSELTASLSVSANLFIVSNRSLPSDASGLPAAAALLSANDGMYTCVSVASSVLNGEPVMTVHTTSLSTFAPHSSVASWILSSATPFPTRWSTSASAMYTDSVSCFRYTSSFCGPSAATNACSFSSAAGSDSASSTAVADRSKAFATCRKNGLRSTSGDAGPAVPFCMAAQVRGEAPSARSGETALTVCCESTTVLHNVCSRPRHPHRP